MSLPVFTNGESVEFHVWKPKEGRPTISTISGYWSVSLKGSSLTVRWVSDSEASSLAVLPDCANYVVLQPVVT